MTAVRVVGGGLAGTEAALHLAAHGISVRLTDIKPAARTPAHHSAEFAELVCSNSLKSDVPFTAARLLKDEMRALGSSLLPIADRVCVPCGGALGVDRARFSAEATALLASHPLITVETAEYTALDDSVPTILCTGPLTTDALAAAIAERVGGSLSFFDAAAPIVDADTVDRTRTFGGARYGKDGDYLNCPLTREEYVAFATELTRAETVRLKGFEGKEVFEGCLPVEVMARRGVETLRFGPCKPVGFDAACYACVQLRPENRERTAYNLVGFQTNLTIPEQKRVFGMIPALRNASYFRYGMMHRNTYLDAPRALDRLRLRNCERIWVAGQLSGVEGYTESMACGLVAALYVEQTLRGEPVRPLPRTTMTGALMSAIGVAVGNFQPINASFGILPPLSTRIADKTARNEALCRRASADLARYFDET